MNHMKKLESSLKTETSKSKRLWMQKCEQLLTHESELVERDQEITRLRLKLKELTGGFSLSLAQIKQS